MMNHPQIHTTRYVLCTSGREDPFSVMHGKVYRVAPPHERDPPADVRVVDETGGVYPYPRDWFVPIALPQEAVEALWGEEAVTAAVERAA